MAHSFDFTQTGIDSNSKKIKKLQTRPSFSNCHSPESDDTLMKKYRTYTKSEKKTIVTALWEVFLPQFGDQDCDADHLVQHLDNIDKEEYNEIIESVLAANAPKALLTKSDRVQWQKDLKQWRRQLKVWVKNIDKPEKRGSVRVVAFEKVAEFKQRISAILREMPNRSFDLLRKEAICVLEEMHNNDKNNTQPFNKNTFSKHFWYDFKKEHPDIEELYDSIPLTRNYNRKNAKTKKATYKDMDIKTEGSTQDYISSLPSPNHDLTTADNSVRNELLAHLDGDISEYMLSSPIDDEALESVFMCQDDVKIEEFNCNGNEENALEMAVWDVESWEMIEDEQNFDFYHYRKTIVETEDDESQKDFFRLFCQNGL